MRGVKEILYHLIDTSGRRKTNEKLTRARGLGGGGEPEKVSFVGRSSVVFPSQTRATKSKSGKETNLKIEREFFFSSGLLFLFLLSFLSSTEGGGRSAQ